jgi:hypothetical protein
VEKAWEMVFGALLSAQDGVQIESSWDRAYEGYLALSASTHHYRMLKKWASVDRKGVYGLMGHVQRNRDVENLLGDAEYAQVADVVSSSAADQLRKRKFQDDRVKAHIMLVKHLVQADLKPQEMDAKWMPKRFIHTFCCVPMKMLQTFLRLTYCIIIPGRIEDH